MATKEELLALSLHFGDIGRQPLKHQDSSDAWNERQNRLAASYDAAKLQIRAALTPQELGKAMQPPQSNRAGPLIGKALGTPPQAYDKVKDLLAQQAQAQRGTVTAGGSSRRLLPEINRQLAQARLELANNPGLNVPEGEGPGSPFPDLARSLKTSGANLGALTLGLPGDVQPIAETFSPALKGRERLPDSDQLIERFGGDKNHPSYLPAAFIAPGPGEFKGLLAMSKAALAKGGPALTALAQPLLHASPFRFEFFDQAKKGTGEGFQAYSAGGIYFSSDDLERGTHHNYLRSWVKIMIFMTFSH